MGFLKKIGGLVLGAVGAVVGFVTGFGLVGAAIGFSIGMGIGTAAQMAAMQTDVPTVSSATNQRLNVSIDPDANRKIAFGETALGTDQVYWETFGPENSYFDQVIAAAGHEIESFGKLYFDDEEVTFSGDSATGDYAGALSKEDRVVGVTGTALTVGAGAKWTSNASLTGIAHYALKIQWSKEKYPRGIPSRVTRIGKGALVYDPRRDSTVPGGSGSHRADDQSTWEYSPLDGNGQPIGRNPALQILWYEIGWRVQNPDTSEQILTCGRGRPIDDIDLESFITAANEVENYIVDDSDPENIQYGLYSDVLLDTGDAHETNIAVLEAACAGKVMDTGGRISLRIRTDNTGDIVQAFTESDVLDSDASVWRPSLPLAQRWNQGKGSFVDPRALFQVTTLPTVRDTSYEAEDGFKRAGPQFRFDAVQDPVQAQRLIRLELNISRYQGVFTAPFGWRAKKVRIWDCVTLTFPRLGFEEKIFRVLQKKTDPQGAIWLLLREDGPTLYTTGTVSPVPAPSPGAGYDPRVVTAPDGGDWTITPTYIEGGGAKLPALGVEGAVSAANIVAVHFHFRQGTGGEWVYHGRYNAGATVRSLRTSVALNTDYYVQIVYENAYGVLSSPTQIGPYTTPTDFAAFSAQIADGIIGQGWGATADEAEASNDYAPFGVNRLYHTRFKKVSGFWAGSGSSGAFGSIGTNTYEGLRYISYLRTGMTAGTYVFFGASPQRPLLACKEGDVVHGSAVVSASNCNSVEAYLTFHDGAGTQIGTAVLGTPETGGLLYLLSLRSKRAKVTAVAPAGAAFVRLDFRFRSAAAGNMQASIAEPYLAFLPTLNTVPPPYQEGRDFDDGADPTAENEAGSVAGQGNMATASITRGTTAERPATPADYSQHANTETGTLQLYVPGTGWVDIASLPSSSDTKGKIATGATSFSANSTWQTLATASFTSVASGSLLSIPYVDIVGQTLTGLAGFGYEWRVTEAPASSPTSKTMRKTGTFSVVSGTPPEVTSLVQPTPALVALSNSGSVLITLEVRKSSGTGTIGLQGTVNAVITPPG